MKSTEPKHWNSAAVVALIEKYSLSNHKLAALLGVHWVTVSRWRNGAVIPPPMQVLLSLIEAQLKNQE